MEVIMSIYMLEQRREIEGIYRRLGKLRKKLNSLYNSNNTQSCLGNIGLLEYEEETLIGKIFKIKNYE